jgi:hypothetical protein
MFTLDVSSTKKTNKQTHPKNNIDIYQENAYFLMFAYTFLVLL